MNNIIRPGKIEDFSAIISIYRACERQNRNALGFIRTDRLERARRAGHLLVSSLYDGDSLAIVVGFVMFNSVRRGAWAGFSTIYSIAVHPDYQRNGFGKELLRAVPTPIRLKCPTLVRKSTPNPAQIFYERYGLVRAGVQHTSSGRELIIWETPNHVAS